MKELAVFKNLDLTNNPTYQRLVLNTSSTTATVSGVEKKHILVDQIELNEMMVIKTEL